MSDTTRSELQDSPIVDESTRIRMANIRQKDTAPELAVQATLEKLGVSFDTDVRGLPGTPDVMVRGKEIPIFVHGCYWHRHEGCRRATTPKRNSWFWTKKFIANQERDVMVVAELTEIGYRPITVWECETEDPGKLFDMLGRALS